MGTKMQCKSYMPAYYTMRDLNEDPNTCSWSSLYYGDKTLSSRQYCNGFLSRVTADAYSGSEKDVVKRTMLEHEAIFKNQVFELHRLYRIQRDLMDEIKRKEPHRNQMPVDTSLSSSPLASQAASEDARKWHDSSFPLASSVSARPLIPCVQGIHSPSSVVKGNIPRNGLFPCQNGMSSKDLEVMESRPTKVRKKMFDLQLPADVYMDSDEGEQFSDGKVSDANIFQPDKKYKTALEGGNKLFFGNSGSIDCKGDALKSDTCLRSTNGLADLNEPVQFEETNTSGYAYPVRQDSCLGNIQSPDLAAKSRSQLLGFPKEVSLNSHHVSDNVIQKNSELENNESGRGWFSHVFEAGQSKSSLTTVSQCPQTERLSGPMQLSAHKPSVYLADKSKVDFWRERTVYGAESSEKNPEISNNKHPSVYVASQVPSPYPTLTSSELAKSRTLSISSWEKHDSSLSQMSISGQTHPCFNSSASLSKSSQSSVQSNGILGDRWNLNNNSSSNQGSRSEVPYQNGVYHGSSSGCKELVRFPSLNCDYQSSSNDHNGGSGHLTGHGPATHYKGSNCMNMKSSKEVNLNVDLSNSSSTEDIPQQGFEIIGGGLKHDYLATLPWLRAKPASKNESVNMARVSKTDERRFFQSSMNNSSNVTELEAGTEPGDSPCKRKLLGFPVFEKSHTSKNESCFLTPSSVHCPSENRVENNRRFRELDINLPFDPSAPDLVRQNVAEILVVEERIDTNGSSFRHIIDLNLCISDDEELLKPSAPSTSVKITVGIDLEVPFVPEIDDSVIPGEASAAKQKEISEASQQHTAEPQDELVRGAAEAMVAISSSASRNLMDESSCNPSQVSSTDQSDPLTWFVDIVSTCANDLESKFDNVLRVEDGEDSEESLSEEFDFFETMTLKLVETKEEDYMPKPLVPEDLKLEETGNNVVSNPPRRGQSRRGRQRRDFQRDILPGLVSLSRHEVTEDLQAFGGIIRGLTRRNSTRNSCGRGRRRAVVSPSPPAATIQPCASPIQQLNNTEVGLEDRSLTGWGKTTRRPRRQRCGAGNTPPLPLT